MDKLKLYAAPIIALVLILIWLFVIQPKLDAGEPAPTQGQQAPQ